MEIEKIDAFNICYKEVNSTFFLMKLTAFILILLFFANPLYEIIDVFHKTFPHGWCCQIPCPIEFGYFFI